MAAVKSTENIRENTAQTFDTEAYLREPVEFYAFRDNDKYKDDIVVGVNGKIYQIKRGVTVRIPRFVRDVIVRSMDLDAKTAELIDSQSRLFADASRAYGL